MVYNPVFGGSTETIRLKSVVGSGMYTMNVQMWTVDMGPDAGQDDAGTGGDAADHHLDYGASTWALGGTTFADGTMADGSATWLNGSMMNATGGRRNCERNNQPRLGSNRCIQIGHSSRILCEHYSI